MLTNNHLLFNFLLSLGSLLVSTKDSADNALKAANAYTDIIEAIEDAEKAALNAQNASSLADEEVRS